LGGLGFAVGDGNDPHAAVGAVANPPEHQRMGLTYQTCSDNSGPNLTADRRAH
jgi:hypothetical protein